MKERPILFNGEMVRAIQDGRKTQTRRVVAPAWKPFKRECEEGWETPWATVWVSGTWHTWDGDGVGGENADEHPISKAKEEAALAAIRQGFYLCPFGQPGDRLWVREAWAALDSDWKVVPRPMDLKGGPWPHVAYFADHADRKGDGPANPIAWRPSIHMPRWASRITLEVVCVRVERLQDITEEDATAEGAVVGQYYPGSEEPPFSCREAFRDLWNSVAKPGATWADNPWVWVVEFKPIEVKS